MIAIRNELIVWPSTFEPLVSKNPMFWWKWLMLGSKWPMFGAQYNRLLARPNRYRLVILLLLIGWLMKLGPGLNEKKVWSSSYSPYSLTVIWDRTVFFCWIRKSIPLHIWYDITHYRDQIISCILNYTLQPLHFIHLLYTI